MPLTVAALLALGGYRAFDKKLVAFDDAYITFRYADNLVAGHGPIYNLGERVEGYTNFAWMLIAAAGIAGGFDPLTFTRVVGLACHTAMLFAIGWFVTRWLFAQGATRLLLLPLLLLLLVPPGFSAMAGSGLETPLVASLLVACALVLGAGDLSRIGTRIALALLLSLAVLTRMDAALWVVAAVVAIGAIELQRGSALRPLVRDLAQVLVPLGVVLAAWTVFRVAYYGSVLPNTYYAKAANHVHFAEGLAYYGTFLTSYPFAPALLLLVFAGLWAREPGQRRLAIFATVALVLEGAFIAKVGGDFMEYRFVWQLYGLLVLGAGLGMSVIARHGLLPGLAVTLTALSVTSAPIKLEVRYGMQSLDEMNNYAVVGTEIGKRFARVLPADTVVATTLAGTMAYYGKRTVIDQWGLNDAYVAHRPWTAPSLTRGHVKFAPLEYLKSRGVNLYIQHPVLCSCARPCRESKPNVFVRLSKGRCMRSWYLTEEPHLTAHFCARPRDFVLNNVRCPGKPKPASAAPAAVVPSTAAGSALGTVAPALGARQ